MFRTVLSANHTNIPVSTSSTPVEDLSIAYCIYSLSVPTINRNRPELHELQCVIRAGRKPTSIMLESGHFINREVASGNIQRPPSSNSRQSAYNNQYFQWYSSVLTVSLANAKLLWSGLRCYLINCVIYILENYRYIFISLIHLLPSIMQHKFYFKITFIIIFKIHKISFKSHFLFNCCNVFRAYETIIRQLLFGRNHRTAWTPLQDIYMLHCMSSLFNNVCPHYTHAILLFRRPCCVLLRVVYLVGRVSLVNFKRDFKWHLKNPLLHYRRKWIRDILMQQDAETKYYGFIFKQH
jgi:hypothetical protein